MPTFIYNLDIPFGAHNPSQDQPLMEQNTNSINSLVNVDHYTFGTANLDGWHKQVTFGQNLSVAPTTAVGQLALYSKSVAGTSQEFYVYDNSGNQIQMTAMNSTYIGTFGVLTAYGTPPAGFTQVGGWTFLPGGLIMQYGFYTKTANLGVVGTIQFPRPFLTSNFNIQLTLYRGSAGQDIVLTSDTPPTLTDFTFKTSSAGSDGVEWFAIGK